MAAFKEHFNIGTVATGVVVVALHAAGLLDLSESFTALFIGIVGALLPDIDSDNSKPLQVVFRILSVSVPLLVLLAFFPAMPVLRIVILWVVFALLFKATLFKLFLHLTHHRGIFHSIPMGVLFAQLTLLFGYYVEKVGLQASTIYAFTLFFGFMTHLVLDEIYSVDAFGARMKKSFGSACKLYDKYNVTGTVIVYVLIVLCGFFLPDISGMPAKIIDALFELKML